MTESPESGEEIISLDEESRVNTPSDENQLAVVPGSGESSRNGSQQSQLVDMIVTEDNPIFVTGRSQDSEVVSIEGDPNVTELMSQLQSNVQSAIVPGNQSQQLMLHSGEEHSTTQLVPVESCLVPINSSQQLVLHSGDSQNQLTPVDIGGGEFHGVRFGPTSTATHKTGCIEGGDFSGARLGPTNIYYVNQSPSTSGVPPGKRETEETSGEDEDYAQISDDIFIYSKEPLREGTRIYKGYQQHASGVRRPLAIKMIVPCTDTHVKEVKHLVNLSSHPNIVQIIHSKELKGTARELYIAMELCSSQNLQDYLDENREQNLPFDFKKTMSLSKQLVSSMTHIHENGIVHRDIKPENVLLSEDGSQLKVTDFGLGKQLRPGSSVTKTRAVGQGSGGYIAAEVYSSGEISQRGDVFSLGITFSNLWTNGKHPFGTNPHLLVYNIINNKGLDFSGLLISGPKRDQLVDLVTKMLQHNFRLRPTMQEVADHPFFKDELTPFEVASGQANFAILETGNPKQDLSETQTDTLTLSDQTVTPTVESTPKKVESGQAENEMSEQELSEKLPDNLKLSEQAASSTVKTKTSTGFFGTISRIFRQKRPAQQEREKQFTSPPAPGVTPSASGSLHAAEMEDIPSTSPTVPGATPSASVSLHAAEMEARARLLLKEFKFTEVVSLLKDLSPSEEQQTMLAECYLRAGDWSKARNAMNTLKTVMASSTPRVTPKSVEDMVDSYISDSLHIKALILLPCASFLHKLDKNPNNAVRGLRNCSISCDKINEALFKQRGRMQGIAVEIGCEIILQILAELRNLTEADESIRARSEASCLLDIGDSHDTIGKPTEAIGFYEQGIKIMKLHFGSNDPKKLLGLLLNNLAATYDSLGDFYKAEKFYLQAIEAYELAQDFASVREKKKEIDGSTRDLQNTRGKMTK